MDNQTILIKLKELTFTKVYARNEIIRTVMQEAVLRRAFNIKENEFEINFDNYEREQFLTDEEIEKDFTWYVELYVLAKNVKCTPKEIEHKEQISAYIEAVSFFNQDLADKLEAIMTKENGNGK